MENKPKNASHDFGDLSYEKQINAQFLIQAEGVNIHTISFSQVLVLQINTHRVQHRVLLKLICVFLHLLIHA